MNRRKRHKAGRGAGSATASRVSAHPVTESGPETGSVFNDEAAFSRFIASIAPPHFTSHTDFVAWQRKLEETTASVVRSIEAAEEAIRQVEAQKLRSYALLDALSAVAVSTVWDERAGSTVAQERANIASSHTLARGNGGIVQRVRAATCHSNRDRTACAG